MQASNMDVKSTIRIVKLHPRTAPAISRIKKVMRVMVAALVKFDTLNRLAASGFQRSPLR